MDGKVRDLATGKVILVGAGPGDPELLTVKAVRALGRADVIVHDGLVDRRILELAPASVSYTHIDVYKRQGLATAISGSAASSGSRISATWTACIA